MSEMRTISANDLLKLAGQGAQIKTPEKPEPERVRDILEAIVEALNKEREPVEVNNHEPPDLAELKDVLDSIARAISNRKDSVINFASILEPLKILAENTRPKTPPRYNFTVMRDQRGRIEQVTAVPDYGE